MPSSAGKGHIGRYCQGLAHLVCRKKRADAHNVYALITVRKAERSLQAISDNRMPAHTDLAIDCERS